MTQPSPGVPGEGNLNSSIPRSLDGVSSEEEYAFVLSAYEDATCHKNCPSEIVVRLCDAYETLRSRLHAAEESNKGLHDHIEGLNRTIDTMEKNYVEAEEKLKAAEDLCGIACAEALESRVKIQRLEEKAERYDVALVEVTEIVCEKADCSCCKSMFSIAHKALHPSLHP